MPLHVSTLEILTNKANFEPRVAVAIAEAIDDAIQKSQPVTWPAPDSRSANLRRDLQDPDVGFAKACRALEEKITDCNIQVIGWLVGTKIVQTAILIVALVLMR